MIQKDKKKGANCLCRQFSHNTGITCLFSWERWSPGLDCLWTCSWYRECSLMYLWSNIYNMLLKILIYLIVLILSKLVRFISLRTRSGGRTGATGAVSDSSSSSSVSSSSWLGLEGLAFESFGLVKGQCEAQIQNGLLLPFFSNFPLTGFRMETPMILVSNGSNCLRQHGSSQRKAHSLRTDLPRFRAKEWSPQGQPSLSLAPLSSFLLLCSFLGLGGGAWDELLRLVLVGVASWWEIVLENIVISITTKLLNVKWKPADVAMILFHPKLTRR